MIGKLWELLKEMKRYRKTAETKAHDRSLQSTAVQVPSGWRGDRGMPKWKELPVCATMRPRGQWCGPIYGESLLWKRFCLELGKSLDLCIHLFTDPFNRCLVCTGLEQFTIFFLKLGGTCFFHILCTFYGELHFLERCSYAFLWCVESEQYLTCDLSPYAGLTRWWNRGLSGSLHSPSRSPLT